MTGCATCQDKGMVTVNWADAPSDYAVCLCDAGLSMRETTNNGRTVPARWVLWASREQVDPADMLFLEDVLTPEELTERGLLKPVVNFDREAALLAAGKSKKPR